MRYPVNYEKDGEGCLVTFPDIPEAWLTRKVDAAALLNTRAFTSWEQRPYLFRFRNTRPITGTEGNVEFLVNAARG